MMSLFVKFSHRSINKGKIWQKGSGVEPHPPPAAILFRLILNNNLSEKSQTEKHLIV